MLQGLETSLKVAQLNHRNQQQTLKDLFLFFYETYLKMSYKQHPFVPTKNLFNTVRVEVLGQIFVFLDIKSLLNVRLVNKSSNEKVKQVIPQYIIQLHKIIQQHEQQKQFLQTKIDSNQEIDKIQNLQKQADDLIDTINQQELNEIKAIRKLSPIMINMCVLLEILLSDKDVEPNSDSLVIYKTNFKNQLYHFDVSRINQKQLEKLQQIHQVNPQQVQNASNVMHVLYQIFQLLVELRETDFYINKSSAYELELKIQKIGRSIVFLKKFLNN